MSCHHSKIRFRKKETVSIKCLLIWNCAFQSLWMSVTFNVFNCQFQRDLAGRTTIFYHIFWRHNKMFQVTSPAAMTGSFLHHCYLRSGVIGFENWEYGFLLSFQSIPNWNDVFIHSAALLHSSFIALDHLGHFFKQIPDLWLMWRIPLVQTSPLVACDSCQ